MARPLIASRYAMEIDGSQPAYIKSLSMPAISGESAEQKLSTDPNDIKHITIMKYEDIDAEIAMGQMGKGMQDWIKASFNKQHVRKDFSIFEGDVDQKGIAEWNIYRALMKEVSFPDLDAGSKEPAYVTCKIAPEDVEVKKGSGDISGTEVNASQTFHLANFNFKMEPIPTNRVTKVGGIKFKQEVKQVYLGNKRIPEIHAAAVKLEDIKLTIVIDDTEYLDFLNWAKQYIVLGESNPNKRLSATLDYLGPTNKDSDILASVNLLDIGLKKISRSKLQAGQAEVATVDLELHVRQVEMSFK